MQRFQMDMNCLGEQCHTIQHSSSCYKTSPNFPKIVAQSTGADYLMAPMCSRAAVPNLFGTRDRCCGRQFFHGRGGGVVVQEVMWVMGSNGERHVKLRLLARHSPPTVRPRS